MQIVHNATGALIARGKAVYYSGSSAKGLLIGLAQANSSSTMPAIGITLEAIGDGTEGRVSLEGTLTALDTSLWPVNSRLYVSASLAGGLTTNLPIAPNLQQGIGYVVVSDANGTVALTSQGTETVHIGQAAAIGSAFEGYYPNLRLSSPVDERTLEYIQRLFEVNDLLIFSPEELEV